MSYLKKILPKPLYQSLVKFYNDKFNNFRNDSYSQEGEDLILKRIFDGQQKGFYIDVGAHHPKRFSNTYYFYRLGWRGINIDARPGSKKEFDKVRANDINLEVAISDTPTELTYFIFDEPALNSFDKELSLHRANTTGYKINKTITIKTEKLSDVLDRYLEISQIIDFLSIDTEGLDISVLRSNDWNKYKPLVILCEDSEFDIEKPNNSEIYNYLLEKGYQLISKTVSTLIFKLRY